MTCALMASAITDQEVSVSFWFWFRFSMRTPPFGPGGQVFSGEFKDILAGSLPNYTKKRKYFIDKTGGG